MTLPRTTFKGMFLATAIVALAVAGLKYPSPVLFGVLLTLTVQAVGIAAIRAVSRGRSRPFLAGFAAVGTAGLALTLAVDRDINLFGRYPPLSWPGTIMGVMDPQFRWAVETIYPDLGTTHLIVDWSFTQDELAQLRLGIEKVSSEIATARGTLDPSYRWTISSYDGDVKQYIRTAYIVSTDIVAIVVGSLLMFIATAWRWLVGGRTRPSSGEMIGDS